MACRQFQWVGPVGWCPIIDYSMFLVGCWLWDDLSYLPWLVLGRLSRVVSTLKKRRATVKPCVVRLGCGRCICVVAHCDASTPDLWALSVPLGGIHIFHLCKLESIGCTLCVPSKREGVPHSDIVARKSPVVPTNLQALFSVICSAHSTREHHPAVMR